MDDAGDDLDAVVADQRHVQRSDQGHGFSFGHGLQRAAVGENIARLGGILFVRCPRGAVRAGEKNATTGGVLVECLGRVDAVDRDDRRLHENQLHRIW